MKTVYKYPIQFHDTTYSMPIGAKPVLTQVQDDQVCVWFELDLNEPFVPRTFNIYGTGFTIPEHEKHIGSCMTRDGALVWHVYER